MMRFLVFLTLLVPSVAFSQYPNKADSHDRAVRTGRRV